MKTLNTIVKILAALAAVAGAVYVVATYGEQITAWAKKVLASLPKCPACEEEPDEEAPAVEEAAEEPAAVEVPMEAPAAEEPAEAPAQEPAPAEAPAPHEPVAEEADFAE